MLGIGGTVGGCVHVRVRVRDGGFAGLAGRGVHPGTSVASRSGEKPQVLALSTGICMGPSVGMAVGVPVGPAAVSPLPARHLMDG